MKLATTLTTRTTLLLLSFALLATTSVVSARCCNRGFDPVGIPYATLSGRVCRNIDGGFRLEPLTYINGTLTWANSLGCNGTASKITHINNTTEFVLKATTIPVNDTQCDGSVFTVHNKIRPEIGDFEKVTMVLGDGTVCGAGPFQSSCDTRDCCSLPAGCPKPQQSGGGSSLCFSASATVEVQSGNGDGALVKEISMADLTLGDKVRTSNGGYQAVYSFAHYDLEASADFLIIHTAKNNKKNSKGALEMTKDHLLFLQDQDTPVTAGSIKVGDKLQTVTDSDGEVQGAVVTKISSKHKQGLYAPLTASGTVVVDGVVASSYVTMQGAHVIGNEDDAAYVHIQGIKTWVSQQQYVHWLLAPHRLLCMGLFPAVGVPEMYTSNGMPPLIDFGIHYTKTAHSQHILIEAIMLLISLSFTGLCCLLESLIDPSIFALAVASLVYYCRNGCKIDGELKKVSI